MFKSIFKPLARNHSTKQKTPGKTQGLGRQALDYPQFLAKEGANSDRAFVRWPPLWFQPWGGMANIH